METQKGISRWRNVNIMWRWWLGGKFQDIRFSYLICFSFFLFFLSFFGLHVRTSLLIYNLCRKRAQNSKWQFGETSKLCDCQGRANFTTQTTRSFDACSFFCCLNSYHVVLSALACCVPSRSWNCSKLDIVVGYCCCRYFFVRKPKKKKNFAGSLLVVHWLFFPFFRSFVFCVFFPSRSAFYGLYAGTCFYSAMSKNRIVCNFVTYTLANFH